MTEKSDHQEKELLFQLDAMAAQMEHARKVAVYGGYFSVGASFEVFSLTLAITGLLVEKGLPFYWTILIFIYFFTGAGFIAYSLFGFGKLKKTEKMRLEALKEKNTQEQLNRNLTILQSSFSIKKPFFISNG